MYFTKHAELKISIYELEKEFILKELNNKLFSCFDLFENSVIQVIVINEILFAVVLDKSEERVITVYRTDMETIEQRKKNGRWLCK